MTVEKMEDLLKAYNANKATLANLTMEEERLSAAIFDEINNFVANEATKSVQPDGLPRGNIISRRVEEIGIKALDGILPCHVKEWMKDLHKLQADIESLLYCVKTVENALQCLRANEKNIIQKKLIEDVSWSELGCLSKKMFGYEVSRSTLKRWKAEALRKMAETSV
jgi:hypothetical protein